MDVYGMGVKVREQPKVSVPGCLPAFEMESVIGLEFHQVSLPQFPILPSLAQSIMNNLPHDNYLSPNIICSKAQKSWHMYVCMYVCTNI